MKATDMNSEMAEFSLKFQLPRFGVLEVSLAPAAQGVALAEMPSPFLGRVCARPSSDGMASLQLVRDLSKGFWVSGHW